MQASQHYFEPRLFRINLNALIQGLRSVTFLLQKKKKEIVGFDEWYGKWQEKMKGDSSLKWLVDARNRIVKQGDLDLSSYLRISVVGSYLEEEVPKFQAELKPALTLNKIYDVAKSCGLPPEMLSKSYVKVERRWVESHQPEKELLDLLSYCWVFLHKLLLDAPCLDQETRIAGKAIESPPPCMPLNSDVRSIWYKYTNGGLIDGGLNSISLKAPSKKQLKKLRKRYGESPLFKDQAAPKDFEAVCKQFFEQAKWVMEKDGYHVFLVVLLLGNVPIAIHQLEPSDKADKFRMMNEMASEVRKVGADGVLMISEVWHAPFDASQPFKGASDCENKNEALLLVASDKSGKQFTFFSPISRMGIFEKRAKVGDLEPFDSQRMNILEPIRNVWREIG